MRDSLQQFAKEYGDGGTRISKFKKYRQRYSVSVVFCILFLTATLFHQYSSLFQGLPYPEYIQYAPGIGLLAIAFLLYLGKRDIDTSTEDITYYELASAIESMQDENVGATLNHIGEVKSEVNRSGNGVFSEQKVERIESYHDRIDNSQNPEGILDDTFEDFFDNLIRELSEENEMDMILEDISTESEDEYEGSVLLDSIRRLRLDMWTALTFIAVVGSLLVFKIVGKDSGYFSAIVSLTAIQILSERRE